MKRIIILIFVFTVIANCEVSPRKSTAQDIGTDNDKITNDFYHISPHYVYHEEIRDEMKYGIWSRNTVNGTHNSGYTIAVVNLTKEALEVELLKLQITELANKN